MVQISSHIIVSIEAIAAVAYFAALIFSLRVFIKTKKATDIWLVISFAIFIGFLMAVLNAFEWFYSQSVVLDTFGEYASIIFSVVWVYIAYRFILFKKM